MSSDHERPAHDFFSLLPERVLAAVERSGWATTGRCYALGSLENRVYDVELEDGRRIVAKFYRPGRWSRETILDEHRLLTELAQHEIRVAAPIPFADGQTLHETAEGIYVALFPRVGGRNPDELEPDDLEELGRILGRIHNVAASLGLHHRPPLSPATYGTDSLAILEQRGQMPPGIATRYADAVHRLVAIGQQRFAAAATTPIHADFHRGNLLRDRDGWIVLDFDDMAIGPAAQDLWLLLPARPGDCPLHLHAFLEGYETFRAFDRSSLGLIEVLRGLRYVRYAAWIASRWEDPSFRRAYPDWGSARYWQEQLGDLYEQLEVSDI